MCLQKSLKGWKTLKKALEHYAKIMKKDDSEVTKKMEDYEKCLGKLCKII